MILAMMGFHIKERQIVSAFRLPMYGVFLLILAACAGASGKWTKAGVGEQVMAADLDQCEFVGLAAGIAVAMVSICPTLGFMV